MAQIKTWHLILSFAVIIIGINILWKYELKSIPDSGNYGSLLEMQENTFSSSVSSGVTCVLFHSEKSDLCRKMEYNIDKVQNNVKQDVKFYKLDIEKYPGQYGNHEISGVPSTVIYKDGQEINRISGIVPASNLRMILNRINYESTN